MRPYSWTEALVLALRDLSRVRLADRQRAGVKLGESQSACLTGKAVNGFAAQELINASRDADLIVVGLRGAGRSGRAFGYPTQNLERAQSRDLTGDPRKSPRPSWRSADARWTTFGGGATTADLRWAVRHDRRVRPPHSTPANITI